MIFARPPKGFNLSIHEREQKKLEAWAASYQSFQSNWDAFCERVVISGHRDGAKVPQLGESNAFVALIDSTSPPDFQVVYTILGDTLTIHAIKLVNIPV